MAEPQRSQQADKDAIERSPSMDGILDVTPVNSVDEAESDVLRTATMGQRSEPASNGAANDEAFSSTSDEDSQQEGVEDGEESQGEESDYDEEASRDSQRYNPSEWDKALLRSRPSKGHASDFFSAPSYSADSSDFLSQAEQEVLREAFTAADETIDMEETSTMSMRSAQQQPRQVASATEATTKVHVTQSTATPRQPQGRSPPTAPPAPPSANNTSTTPIRHNPSFASHTTGTGSMGTSVPGSGAGTRSSIVSNATTASTVPTMRPHPGDDLSSGVLPDVLMTMRQKIESLTLFDSDMMRLAAEDDDPTWQEDRESLKRSSQQSISAAVLVSLAHKRYERRRLAAMEIEKVVRSLVNQKELERVRAILLLLSDDYVRSTSEDARKGGVVALAACAIGLKKAHDNNVAVQECRDLILASVVHACQDFSQRVRYYATESLFNVVKVIPSLAVQHFFILFEILRSLYADVDVDVRSGAELLDKKLKEVIVTAMNAGSFTADACVPVFARFVYMRNKATKRLTLTWLQELNEKLIGAPILEFLHLFLGGIFDMVADPTLAIRQSALAFLQSVLPKLLVINSEAIDDMDDQGMMVDFDKILQSLVTTMEHPDPFVRKVAMHWMSRIVKAHMSSNATGMVNPDGSMTPLKSAGKDDSTNLSAASISVRNSLPHVLPGILLSIGDNFQSSNAAKDTFLPDQTTRALAEQTNSCLQEAVRRDGQAYVQHLDGFIVALREELDSPGGLSAKNPPAVERTPYRMDVAQDGTGIESGGWFRASNDTKERSDDSVIMSRLCALQWVIVLYESVVPDQLKADYAREFVFPIIHQLVDSPPQLIVFKSLEVLAKITVPVAGENSIKRHPSSASMTGLPNPTWASSGGVVHDESQFPMTDASVEYALETLDTARRKQKSRDREVFAALIQLHSHNEELLVDLSNVITYMCKLQPPEFVLVSFAVELDRFFRSRKSSAQERKSGSRTERDEYEDPFSRDLRFVSSFVQHMNHVLLNADETKHIRIVLKDCIGAKENTERDRQRSRVFHILLQSFSHNLASTLSLCLWAGAYRTASLFLRRIDPLDINLLFLLEVDRLVELLERPLFRHLHVRMLERDKDPMSEGSGAMLFQTLKSLLAILSQSTCYNVLKERLISVSRFRQSTIAMNIVSSPKRKGRTNGETEIFVTRIQQVRKLHCAAAWLRIRAESLETPLPIREFVPDEGADRREWLGYASKEDEQKSQQRYQDEKNSRHNSFSIEEIRGDYHDLKSDAIGSPKLVTYNVPNETATTKPTSGHPGTDDVKQTADEDRWKKYWATTNT